MSQQLALELEKGKDFFDITAKENQNIIENVSTAFSNAVSKGVENIGLDAQYKSVVKEEVKKPDFLEIGKKVGEAALRIGAKAIGINTTTFNNGFSECWHTGCDKGRTFVSSRYRCRPIKRCTECSKATYKI